MTIYEDDLIHGVRLIRKVSTRDVGTPQFWSDRINELFLKNPEPELFKNVTLEVRDMSDASLVEENKRGEINLLDCDLSTTGNQSCAGLTWGDIKKVTLGVYGGENGVLNAALTLPHEWGHMVQSQSAMCDSNLYVGKCLSKFFEELRPKQSNDVYEDFSECYRATCGTPGTYGTFSDGKQFTPSIRLSTLMKLCFAVKQILQGKAFSDLKLHGEYFTWSEWKFEQTWILFIPFQRWVFQGEYKLGLDRVLYRSTAGTWVKI